MKNINFTAYPTLASYLENYESYDLNEVEKHFRQDVENTLEAKHNYILNHFRYNTMNSWNRVTNFANNVKVHNLNLPKELEAKMYDFLSIDETYDSINEIIEMFGKYYNYKYQVAFNGKSGGYIVLYLGNIETYKDKEGNDRTRSITYPGRTIQIDEDINEMHGDIEDIFELVCDLDLICDLMRFDFIQTLSNNIVISKEIMVPKTIHTLRHNSIESEESEETKED